MNIFYIYFLSLVCLSCTTTKSTTFGYRLGDMVKSKEARDSADGREFHFKNFPDSIATEYMKKTDEDNRFDILIDIVQKRTVSKDQTPPEDMLLIHLRIGDVIDRTPYMVKDFLSRYIMYVNGHNYVKPLSYYESLLDSIRKYNIKKITLLGGFHSELKSTKKSLKYVQKIREFFESKGFNVDERINFNADDDFIYMCNANYFTPGGGGYSGIVNEILKIKKKHLIIPPTP